MYYVVFSLRIVNLSSISLLKLESEEII